MIKVGDTVRATSYNFGVYIGGCYATWLEFFNIYDLPNYSKKYAYGEPMPEGTYKVLAYRNHPIWGNIVYVLCNKVGSVYLVSNEGNELEVIYEEKCL